MLNDTTKQHSEGVYGKLDGRNRELKVKQLKNQHFMFQKMHTDNEKVCSSI